MKNRLLLSILLFFCAIQMAIMLMVAQQGQLLPSGLLTASWRQLGAAPSISQYQSSLAQSSSWSFNVTDQGHRHAYAFLVAAVDPKFPFYKGFLYNILVSTRILRDAGSTADVVVMIQMSTKTNRTTLPEEDAEPLQKSKITIIYLEKAKEESFYNAVMEKFRILELVNYTRVLFMDADLMPYCNLDYLFHLSEGPNAILKPNLIMAWMTEPSNAGFFMLEPGVGQFQELRSHIDERDRIGANLPYPHFDVVKGFGHEIVPPDYWMTLKGEVGTNWTFQSAFGGQGLLYHWTKYVKKNVSIILNDKIQNWSALPNGTVYMEREMIKVLQPFQCHNISWWRLKNAPQSDFKHFTGKLKPWERKRATPPVPEGEMADSPTRLWFHIIRQLKRDLNMTKLDVEKMQLGKPNLGRNQGVAQMNKDKQLRRAAAAAAAHRVTREQRKSLNFNIDRR